MPSTQTALAGTAPTEVLPLPYGMRAQLILRAPLVVRLPAAKATALVRQVLADVLHAHPGNGCVQIRAYDGDLYDVLPFAQRVDIGPALTADLKQLFGPTCLEATP